MWLINVRTRQLEQVVEEAEIHGRYAILSHVWEKDEASFRDLQDGVAETRAGYAKIEYACRQASADRLDYCWIDTCCIDKASSAELSEAINSMFRYYKQAKVCYAFLFDVPEVPLGKSKWFTRGWTLQELIAPGYVEFYNAEWEPVGSKISMVKELAELTRIDIKVLRDRTQLSSVSVAARMAWAADRKTSREEDRAYSLMGIFDVNMPMLYGEGPKAFTRLQEEIIKNSTDHSILAWTGWEDAHYQMLFSPSPFGFRLAHNILSWSTPGFDESFLISNEGLRITLPVLRNGNSLTAIINCRYDQNAMRQISLLLRSQSHGMIVPTRELKSTVCDFRNNKKPDGTLTSLQDLDRKHLPLAEWMDLLILRQPARLEQEGPTSIWTQKIVICNDVQNLVFLRAHPHDAWDDCESTMTQVVTGSSHHDRSHITFSERNSTWCFTLVLRQEMNSGRSEPRIFILRHALTEDLNVLLSRLESAKPEQTAKTEFKKGLSQLLVEVERRLSSTGELEWAINFRLERYSTPRKNSSHGRQGSGSEKTSTAKEQPALGPLARSFRKFR